VESVWSVSKLSTKFVRSRRDLVANYCVHTADADTTQLDSSVALASEVCIGHKSELNDYERNVRGWRRRMRDIVAWRRDG